MPYYEDTDEIGSIESPTIIRELKCCSCHAIVELNSSKCECGEDLSYPDTYENDMEREMEFEIAMRCREIDMGNKDV